MNGRVGECKMDSRVCKCDMDGRVGKCKIESVVKKKVKRNIYFDFKKMSLTKTLSKKMHFVFSTPA